MKNLFPFIVLALFLTSVSCAKKVEVNVTNRILDSANLLTRQQEDSIFQEINDLENNIGSQIFIITIDSLGDEDIETYSLRTANRLGVGRAKFNDGILITVSLNDRRMRIEVGAGLEKIIGNEIAATIISDDMGPRFKTGDYAGGLMHAVQKIKQLIEQNKELVGQSR